MPYTREWIEYGRIIKTAFNGALTLPELKQSSEEASAMMEEGQAPVHIITDLTHLKQFPTNLLQVKDALPHLSHPAIGWQVFYGAPSLAMSLIGIFGHVSRTRTRAFVTYEQAVQFLKSQDATLKIDVSLIRNQE